MKTHNPSNCLFFDSTFCGKGGIALLVAIFGVLRLATSLSLGQSVPSVTNRFEGGLGTFTYQQNLTALGNDIGWSATANAGGSSGEVGGTFARNDHNNAPFVGEVWSSVVPLNLNEILSFSGKFVLTNVNFDGSFGPCFFNTNTFGTTNFTFLAFRIIEPSSPGGPFRTSLRSFGPGPGSGAGSAVINVPGGVPASFQVTWQPSGLGNNSGTGTLTVTTPTSTNTVTHTYTAAVTFNAFGVGGLVHEQGTPADPTKTSIAYFDDLIYSVPPAGPPQILKQPTAPAVIYAGNAFTMFAVVGGDAPLEYQWRKISGGVTNDVASATNSSITFNPATLSDAGTYFLVASNSYNGGSVTNSALVILDVQNLDITPSFTETGGKVVIDAEHYDRNWVVNNAGWLYDTTWPGYSGDGYVSSVCSASQGNNWTTNPHLDYYVHFDNPGTWYLWLRGADVGNRRATVALNGTVSSTANPVGNSTGAFGSMFSGSWTWCGFYSANPLNYAAISIPGPGDYAVSVFMNNETFLLDQILLTQDAGYVPGGPETETPASGSLRVKVATPSDATLISGTLTNGQSLLGTGPKLVAASVLRGANPISKVEFYAGLVGSSSNKIGEATAFPWQIMWTNYAIGTNALTAKVTDSGGGTAISANVVKAILANTYVAPYTPPLYTNDFTGGAKTFTYITNNGVVRPPYTASFGWQNTSYAGGGAGEVGGLFMRSQNATVEFIGVLFESPVNFYFDGLWTAGTLVITNPITLGSDGDIRLGYAIGTAFGTDLAVDIRPPGAAGGGGTISGACRWRFGAAFDIPAPYDIPFSFEVRWQPSPLGNGYLAKTMLVCDSSFGSGYAATQYVINSRGTPSTALNCFGIGSWAAGSSTTNLWLINADNLTYVVPRPKLQLSLSGDQLTLKWPCSVPAYNLWWTPALDGTPVWAQSGLPSPTPDAGAGTYNVTETADQTNRFYRLQY